MKLSLDKRQKYFLLSLATVGVLYFFEKELPEINFTLIIISALLVLVGSFVVHLPNSKLVNTLITSILPLALLFGYLLSLVFFPNLSEIFKLASLVAFGGLFYMISLVNNVFLVVESREEPIPLYRVAVTWSKILIAAVSIPLLAGLFKISINSFGEALLTTAVSLLFFVYLVWLLRYNPDTKKYKVGEIATVLALGAFMLPVSSLSVSFIPTETFLRALYVSSILIFGLSYIEAHLKNSITKKLISEHIAISLVFLLILFIFRP